MFESLLRGRIAERNKVEEKKLALVSDPLKLDEYAGKIFQQLSPSDKMASKKKAELRTGRVDAKIPDDHPLKGFGDEFKTVLQSELANPKNSGYSVQEISTGITRSMLSAKDESGMTRLEKAHHYRYLDQNDLWFNKDTKKDTLALPGMPTYKEWAANRKEGELAAMEEDRKSGESILADTLVSTYVGGVMGAGIGFAAGGPPGALLGAKVGAVSGLAGETLLRDLRYKIGKSDWLRSKRFSSRITDKIIGHGVPALPEAAIFGTMEAKIMGGFARTAAREAVAKPVASNVVKASKAAEVAQKVAAKDPVAAARAVVSGVEPEGTVNLGHRMLKVSRAMVEEAMPEGTSEGIAILPVTGS